MVYQTYFLLLLDGGGGGSREEKTPLSPCNFQKVKIENQTKEASMELSLPPVHWENSFLPLNLNPGYYLTKETFETIHKSQRKNFG